jgi:hypothetical protein
MKDLKVLPLLAVALWALPLGAQINRGILEGTVTDPSGAVIPGVEVAVTSVDSGVVTTTKTNGAGYYLVMGLIPGIYKARLVSAGFSPLELTDIAILAGKEIRLDTLFQISAVPLKVEQVQLDTGLGAREHIAEVGKAL